MVRNAGGGIVREGYTARHDKVASVHGTTMITECITLELPATAAVGIGACLFFKHPVKCWQMALHLCHGKTLCNGNNLRSYRIHD